jgi:hypothetical protein
MPGVRLAEAASDTPSVPADGRDGQAVVCVPDPPGRDRLQRPGRAGGGEDAEIESARAEGDLRPQLGDQGGRFVNAERGVMLVSDDAPRPTSCLPPQGKQAIGN